MRERGGNGFNPECGKPEAQQPYPIILDPMRVAFDLDGTLFHIAEDNNSNITSVVPIEKNIRLIDELKRSKFHLTIYTAGLYNRIRILEKYFPKIIRMFAEVYTRESLLNADTPMDAQVRSSQYQLLRDYKSGNQKNVRWRPIEIPNGLSAEELKAINAKVKNRGKVPALIRTATIFDDRNNKCLQIGPPETRVKIVNPRNIPEDKEELKAFIATTFPHLSKFKK